MKINKSILPALLIILFMVSGFLYEVNGQVEGEIEGRIEGRWSGTISLHTKSEGKSLLKGTWSDLKIDVSIIDNKGTGTVKYEGETMADGYRMGKVSCSGSGSVELYSLVINRLDNILDFYIESPPCNSADDPNGNTQSISITQYPLGQNPNLLSGTETRTTEMPNGEGTTTTTIKWNLVRSTDVELIVTPQNYDNWLPEPGRDELTKGSVMNISFKLEGVNGKPLTVKATSFELWLSNTSTEPGITINFPIAPDSPGLPDLRLLEEPAMESMEEDQYIEIPCNDGVTGKAYIGSYDGGGWATLTVIAILEDNSKIKGSLLVQGGEQEIRIPKRDLNSKIAKAWLTANGNPGESNDQEKSTGNTNPGDGLSAYEEYRGVISEGKFLRLDPNKKELGVKMKKAEFTLFSDGIAKFENASGLKVIRFFENEIGADRKLNKNFLTANIYKQYALFLQKGTLTGDLGKSFDGPAIPMQVSKTVIDQNRIRLSFQDRLAEANSINVSLSYTEKDLFASVTAHELAHSVKVPHHGSLAPNSINVQIQPQRPVRIFDYQRREIIRRPYPITGRGGDIGNEQSGDVNCFMLNNALCDWAVRTTPDSMFFYQVPLIPLGTKLCDKKAGTGLNSLKDANGNYKYFGDAANGNCLSQIKLK